MNILVLAPHPDDEVLGCGGAICAHHEEGARVTVLYVTSGENGSSKFRGREQELAGLREDAAHEAGKILGIERTVFLHFKDGHVLDQNLLKRVWTYALNCSLIYVPNADERHPDHRAVANVFKGQALPCPIRYYEVWTPLNQHNVIVDTTAYVDRKNEALLAYENILGEGRDYVSAFEGLAAYRAWQEGKGMQFAEVFHEVKA